MRKRIQHSFDKLAPVYEQSVDQNSIYNTEYERPAMMKQLPNNLQGKYILDAGCAAGWYSERLTERGGNVTAVDFSPKMVESTKRRLGDRAKVFVLDLAEELPFKDQQFDIIVCSLTLHYIEDWRKTFQEFRRILKANGIFLFSVHHPSLDMQLNLSDNYFFIEKMDEQWKKEGKLYDVSFYRRPLQDIINVTASYFTINQLTEPVPTEEFKRQAPDKYARLMQAPNFLLVKAVICN